MATSTVFLLLAIQCLGSAAFTPPPVSFLDGIKSALDRTFAPPSIVATGAEEERLRAELKTALLEECREGGGGDGRKRERIEGTIKDLVPLCPTERTAPSPLLQKKWILEWTTEKEINFFSDWGISGVISQTIDGNLLGNDIEFKRGGGLSVSGKLSLPSPEEEKEGGRRRGDRVRTNFKFTSATLDLGRWGRYELPPVGEGWFDTVYLDGGLRIDTNSRNDILICTPEQ